MPTDPTQSDFINAILDAYNVPHYDPARHLIAEVACLRWGVKHKSALERLKAIANERGLDIIDVIGPQGKIVKALVVK